MSNERTTIGRVIFAVVTGYLFIIALLGITYLLAFNFSPGVIPKPGINAAPSPDILIIAATIFFFYAVMGGWVTTLLAKNSGLGPGLVLAGVTLIWGLLKPVLAPHQELPWSHMIF